MKRLFAFDLVILAYLAIVSVIVLLYRPDGWWIFLSYHLAIASLITMVVYAHDRFGGRFWEILRYWYAIPVVLCTFRELHYLFVNPGCPPFDSPRFDHLLGAFDQAMFGDVDAFFLAIAQPQLIDFLHLCYMSYFILIVAPAVVPFCLGERERVREAIAITVAGLYLSYLGYFLVPAVGPHHFFAERPGELDGWILGGFMYKGLMWMELRTPDAFPSGHTLASVVALVVSWRNHRPTFWVLLVPALGLVWATMALRYHYVVDVVAGLALVPLAVIIGMKIHAWCEASSTGKAPSWRALKNTDPR